MDNGHTGNALRQMRWTGYSLFCTSYAYQHGQVGSTGRRPRSAADTVSHSVAAVINTLSTLVNVRKAAEHTAKFTDDLINCSILLTAGVKKLTAYGTNISLRKLSLLQRVGLVPRCQLTTWSPASTWWCQVNGWNY